MRSITTTFSPAGWETWHAERLALARDPYGPASLKATHWLTDEVSVILEDLPGYWRTDGGQLRGDGLGGEMLLCADGRHAVGGNGVIFLQPGQEVHHGKRRFRAFARDGALALRVFDPDTANVADIRSYHPDPAWVLLAKFEPGGQVSEVTLREWPSGV